MPPATIKPEGLRRWIAVATTMFVMLPILVYAALAATATASVAAARSGALLADGDADRRAVLRALPQDRIDAALTARPLDQRLVNVAMARDVDRRSAGRQTQRIAPGIAPGIAPWIVVVSRLGWRDTTALQNMLYVAAAREDVPAAFDITDALLRRRQLSDQIVPALSAVEAEAPSRELLVTRLAGQPSWRGLYLTATAHLRTPAQFAGRYELLRALRRRGSPAMRSEATRNVQAFEQAGFHALGFALWRSVRPGVTRPLDDTGFARAGEDTRLGEDDPVAYQWQFSSGEGYRADAIAAEGRATLDIDWNGRGVPVFAQQRTSAAPGRYAIEVGMQTTDLADLAALDFRLVCDAATIPLRQDARVPRRFVTEGPVPCAYPMLQIAGGIQSAVTPRHLSIRSVSLRPLPYDRGPG